MTIYNSASAAALIRQMGRSCSILRAETTGTDTYRNPKKEWNKVATERVVRLYPSDRLWSEQMNTVAGEIDEDNPIFVFRREADIEDGDKIVYDGTEYRIQSISVVSSHARATGQKV